MKLWLLMAVVSANNFLTSYFNTRIMGFEQEETDVFSKVEDFYPSEIPTFDIDLDLPATERHKAVWDHFGEQLLDMENLFLRQLNAMNSSYL